MNQKSESSYDEYKTTGSNDSLSDLNDIDEYGLSSIPMFSDISSASFEWPNDRQKERLIDGPFHRITSFNTHKPRYSNDSDFVLEFGKLNLSDNKSEDSIDDDTISFEYPSYSDCNK